MNNSLVSICYEGVSGTNNIRTFYLHDILYISLKDVNVTLNKENREMDEQHISKHMVGVVKSILGDLDDDEFIYNPTYDATGDYNEIFVTQPGLNRVMASNKSKAGKKFQRWLYHEVIPSLTKHGVYPPPSAPKGSALSQVAEMVAQNSRSLADMIVKQEEFENNVVISHKKFKTDIQDVSSRVEKLETNNLDSPHIMTVGKWINDKGYNSEEIKTLDLLPWCENLILQGPQKSHPCPSGERKNKKFPIKIIDEAFSRFNINNPDFDQLLK